MSFSNSDLKRLKFVLSSMGKLSFSIYTKEGQEWLDIAALVSRLEAAELVASQVFTGCDLKDYEAWRKSKGEGGGR